MGSTKFRRVREQLRTNHSDHYTQAYFQHFLGFCYFHIDTGALLPPNRQSSRTVNLVLLRYFVLCIPHLLALLPCHCCTMLILKIKLKIRLFLTTNLLKSFIKKNENPKLLLLRPFLREGRLFVFNESFQSSLTFSPKHNLIQYGSLIQESIF